MSPLSEFPFPNKTAAGDIKKRYWRLSLLIHPDKCDHAQALEAFQAVTRAAKELQVRARASCGFNFLRMAGMGTRRRELFAVACHLLELDRQEFAKLG